MAGKNKRGSGNAGSGSGGSGNTDSRAIGGSPSSSGGRLEQGFESPSEGQVLLMQLVGLDNSYQGLMRSLLSCLDDDAKKRLARNSEFQAWANELEFFRNNDTLPGMKFARIGRPSCVPAYASGLAVAV